jgi:hydroxymethylglutaryl-CoA lyase
MGKSMSQVRVVEVGPRDGLQNEPSIRNIDPNVLVDSRVALVVGLARAGFLDVEAGAFVRADRIPAMAHTDKVLAALQTHHPDLWASKKFWVLVPNERGLDLALQAGAKHVSVFTATSDAFNEQNVQMSVKESLAVLKPVVERAKQSRLEVRGYVSTVWGCPYSGPVTPDRALMVAESLFAMGVNEVSLGDTIGVATPNNITEVLQLFSPQMHLAAHFHDTRGTAIANCLAAIEWGIRVVDSACGGLGGCPYAKGASGNLATEDLLYMLHGMGFRTGVDEIMVAQASAKLEKSFGLSLPSRAFKAWKGKQI